jgi:hypothetical protein
MFIVTPEFAEGLTAPPPPAEAPFMKKEAFPFDTETATWVQTSLGIAEFEIATPPAVSKINFLSDVLHEFT